MFILTLLINILKFLLVLLGVLFFIFIIFLFARIKFDLNVKINDRLGIFIKIKYLFIFLNYEESKLKIRLFGINLENFKKFKRKNKKCLQNDLKSNIIQETDKNESEESEPHNISKLANKKMEDKIKNNRNKNLGNSYSIEDLKNFFKIAIEFLPKIFKLIKVKKFNLNLEYGFNDPSITGYTQGLIEVIKLLLKEKFLQNIKVSPDFNEGKFLGTFYIKGNTYIFKILFPVLCLLLKKDILKLIFRKGEKNV